MSLTLCFDFIFITLVCVKLPRSRPSCYVLTGFMHGRSIYRRGKYETLLDDSLLALHTINASNIQFPHLARTSGTAEKLHKYFSQLDLPLIRKLYKIYRQDYKIFNYELDNIVGFDLG